MGSFDLLKYYAPERWAQSAKSAAVSRCQLVALKRAKTSRSDGIKCQWHQGAMCNVSW